VPLTLLRHAQPLLCDEAAAPSPLTPAYADSDFDRALNGILTDAAKMGLEPALDSWLERLDDVFIPTLAGRVEASTASGAAELPQLTALFEALELRTSSRFERAREQLQTLLAAGEINDMNAQLIRLVKKDEIDAGFVYVLLRNIEDAEKNGEEPMVRLLSHLHTVTQEELEKRTAPALGLLHKLTRLDDAGIRGRVLRDNLSPKTSLPLPDGSEMPLAKPTAAKVAPLAFAEAVEETLEKVLTLPVDREMIASTVESIRLVAKEARVVVEESYDQEDLDAFTDALTPVFQRAK
jgi:hypothetical protein